MLFVKFVHKDNVHSCFVRSADILSVAEADRGGSLVTIRSANTETVNSFEYRTGHYNVEKFETKADTLHSPHRPETVVRAIALAEAKCVQSLTKAKTLLPMTSNDAGTNLYAWYLDLSQCGHVQLVEMTTPMDMSGEIRLDDQTTLSIARPQISTRTSDIARIS